MLLAYQLEHRLTFLTLAGYSDSEYQWMTGSGSWDDVERADALFESN